MALEQGGNQQQANRKVALIVRLRFPSVKDFRYRYTTHISKGNLFVKSPKPRPLGSLVEFQIEVTEAERSLILYGEVVQAITAEISESLNKEPGMVINFIDITPEKKTIIEGILSIKQEKLEYFSQYIDMNEAAPRALESPVAAPALTPPATPLAVDASAPAESSKPSRKSREREAALIDELKQFMGWAQNKNHYEILGVSPQAILPDIQKAFWALTTKYHPDSLFGRENDNLKKELEDAYQRICEGYEVLSDHKWRMEYDISIGNITDKDSKEVQEEKIKRSREMEFETQFPEKAKRAQELYQTARREHQEGNTASAVVNLKLAIAYNPINEDYKHLLKELQKS